MGRTVIGKKDISRLATIRKRHKFIDPGNEWLEEEELLPDTDENFEEEVGADSDEDLPDSPMAPAEDDAISPPAAPSSAAPSSAEGDLYPEADKYTTKLLKYIPAEVIALYLTLDTLIRSADQIPVAVYWGIFLFGIIATYLYLWRVENVAKQGQLVISMLAYCIWVFAIGGPFTNLEWYDPIYGGILLPIFTFMVPIIEA
jgi:hypothetical protein